jgi:hypothetical protein
MLPFIALWERKLKNEKRLTERLKEKLPTTRVLRQAG